MTVAEAKQYMEEGQFGEDDSGCQRFRRPLILLEIPQSVPILVTKLNKDGTYVSGGPGTMITK